MSIVQRDYIMREIEQLGQLLALVIRICLPDGSGVAKEARFEEALGIDFQVLTELNELEALELLERVRATHEFRQRPSSRSEWWISIAIAFEVLAEHEIDKLNVRNGTVFRHLARAAIGRIAAEEEAAVLVAKLPLSMEQVGRPIPTSIKGVCWIYSELTGELGRAEDWLFGILDDRPHDTTMLNHGRAFYARLLKKPDDELEKGRLPRTEVWEGLIELRGRDRQC